MYEIITLGAKDVPMTANAATPVYFKEIFQEDLLTKFGGADEDPVWMARLAFVMAMQGSGAEMDKVNGKKFIEWLEGFDPLDIYSVEASNKVVELFSKQQKTTAEAKKKSGKPNGA